MTDPLEHILRLAFEIGPRPGTGEGARKASAYIRDQLEEYGFSVKVESFRSPRSYAHYLLPIYLLALAGAVVAVVLNSAALGLLLSGIALVAFLGEVTTALRLVSILVRTGHGQNVIARLAPKEMPRRHLVVVAHYDSPKPEILMHPRLVRGYRMGFRLLSLSLLMLPLLLALSAALNLRVVALATAPFALVVAIAVVVLLHRELFGRYVAGANGNASGVAVMLTLCEALSVDAPADTEVLALATGCQDAGMVGMQAFMRKHADELDRAWVLNIDSVGAGEVFYTTSEGMLLGHATSRELREVAEKVGALAGVSVTGRPFKVTSTDTEPLLLRRLDAISVMAGEDGVPINWRWRTDTMENIDPDSIDTAYKFTEAIVRRLIA